MYIQYYVFNKNIYEYKYREDGVEIRRKDGKDIDYEGDIEPVIFDEDHYKCILKYEGEKRAEDYKNSCNPKIYTIYSGNYQIIDDNYYLENHVGVDVFIVVDYN